MSPFAVESTTHGPRCDVVVSGELDPQTVGGFLAASLAPLEGSVIEVLAVDLDAVTFIDSAGIAALVQLHNRAHELGKQLVLCRPNSRVLQILDITALDSVFAIEPSPGA
jgi:anti-sigma B factor antagonist